MVSEDVSFLVGVRGLDGSRDGKFFGWWVMGRYSKAMNGSHTHTLSFLVEALVSED